MRPLGGKPYGGLEWLFWLHGGVNGEMPNGKFCSSASDFSLSLYLASAIKVASVLGCFLLESFRDSLLAS